MEIRFIYHKSSLKICKEIITKVIPPDFLKSEEKSTDDVFIEKYHEPSIEVADVYFVFFSKAAMLSDSFSDHIYALYSKQEKTRSFLIQPIRIDECSLPLFILRSKIITFTAEEISSVIFENTNQVVKPNLFTIDVKQSQDIAIKDLQKSYVKKEMILYCGAGTSFNNGIPTWKELLYNIFVDVYSTVPTSNINIDTFYETIDRNCGISLPILARYLKNELKEHFEAAVVKQLYKHIEYEGNDLISSIIHLCKATYMGVGSVKSIITTNFDDIFEKNFKKEKIDVVSVYNSDQQAGGKFPIYHVHGYLPKDSKLPQCELVFSEDTYHSQFYLPYKWQNLIQLDAFNHNTCLFIGVGFTDPNLRRLLDISRNQCGSKRQHYIIRRVETVNKLASSSGFSEKDTKIFLQALNRFQEEDAKKLGLKYLLVNNYDEIPQILRRIGEN